MSRQFGLLSLIVATLLTGACKSKSQDAAPAPASPTTEAAGRPAQLSPIGDDTLSFARAQEGKCTWVRLDASRDTRRNVFTFEGGCELAQFAWSHDGLRGAVLQSFEEERPPRAWMVDLLTGQDSELPLPEVGRTIELGFDAEGRPVALVAHYDSPGMKPPERDEEDGQTAFVFEDKRYPFEVQEGEPGLAHAYRREGTEWKRVETQVTSYGAEFASETQVLALAKELGPNTRLDPKEVLRSESVSPEEQEALDASAPMMAERIGPRGEDLETSTWVRASLPGGPLYYQEEQVESLVRSLPLRWRVGGKLVEPEKLALPQETPISLSARGNMLLINSGRAVRLYDVKQKKHLLSLDAAYQPYFWPRPHATSGASVKLSMNIDDSRAALDFLESSSMRLEENEGGCAQLAEGGTLGAVVKKARAEATEWSVQCEAQERTKTWACQARFIQRGEEEDSDGPAMMLRYSVDDAARAIQTSSLVCQMAG
jgi:hypothetical protein